MEIQITENKKEDKLIKKEKAKKEIKMLNITKRTFLDEITLEEFYQEQADIIISKMK